MAYETHINFIKKTVHKHNPKIPHFIKKMLKSGIKLTAKLWLKNINLHMNLKM